MKFTYISLVALAFIQNVYAVSIPVIAMKDESQITVGEINSEHYKQSLLITKEALDQKVVSGLASMQTEVLDGSSLSSHLV